MHTFKSIRDYLQTVGIKCLRLLEFAEVEQVIQRVTVIKKEMRSMLSVVPKLKESFRHIPLKQLELINNEQIEYRVRVGHRGSSGQYWLANMDKIQIAVRGLDSVNTLCIGDFKVTEDNDLCGVLRHEIGHHVYNRLGYKESWDKLFNSRDKAWWKKNVSKYSSIDADEALAESLCAYTSSVYKKGLLPKEVTRWMEK